jgi:undecaprenyl-diphosphatase
LNEFDRSLLLALRSDTNPGDPIGPVWMERMAVDITALGGHTALLLLVLCVASLLIHDRQRGAALWLLLGAAGAMLLNHGLKIAFARARPDLVEHLVVVVTHSFPSGHALMSAAVYLMLATLAGHLAAHPLRRHLIVIAVVLTLLVGLSRVYLGVHWPSDVLAGWLIGSLWAWGCWRLLPSKEQLHVAR